MDKIITREERDLVTLMACALNGTVPNPDTLKNIDYVSLYQKAQKLMVVSLAGFALEKAGAFDSVTLKNCLPDEQLEALLKIREAKDKAVRKNIMLDAERGRILREFDNCGIHYLLLKGILLQKLYPEYGMRQMADNDILFEEAYHAEVLRIMTDLGYTAEQYGNGTHDVYQKKPVFNFEMHRRLFGITAAKAFREYYAEVFSRTLDGGGLCERVLTPEDTYIYILAHAYKHHSGGGTGIRTLADFYVYDRTYGASMDRNYIDTQLHQLGIVDFERELLTLAKRIFGGDLNCAPNEYANESDWEALSVFLKLGAYGSTEQGVVNSVKKMAGGNGKVTAWVKIKYLLRRMFPPIEWYRANIGVLNRFPVLIPFYAILRLMIKPFTSSRKLKREFRTLHNIDSEEQG